MRQNVTVLTVLLLSAACMGVGAQTLPDTVHACVSITSDKERLACFDREIARLYSTEPKDVAQSSSGGKAGGKTTVQASTGAPASGASSTARPTAAAVSTATPAPGASPTATPSPGANATASAATPLAPEQAFG